MKRFAFRLQVVLDRACQEEEKHLLRLGQLRQEMVAKEQEIACTQERRRALLAEMSQRQQQAFDAHDLAQCRLHLDALVDTLARLGQERLEIAQRIAAQEALVVEAMKKRQLLESLREQHHTAYLQETARQELQSMEEAVLPRLIREHQAIRAQHNISTLEEK